MLLSVPGKVLKRVLLERMKEAAPKPAGWVPQEQILCGSDCRAAHHCRAVARVELPPLHQLHRLREGVRQRGQRNAVEAA